MMNIFKCRKLESFIFFALKSSGQTFLKGSRDNYGTNLTIIDKSVVDGVLGTQTRGGRKVGTDESIELCQLRADV